MVFSVLSTLFSKLEGKKALFFTLGKCSGRFMFDMHKERAPTLYSLSIAFVREK